MVDQAVMNMIFAVSRGRTLLNYEDRHYCLKHNKLVDRHHIDNCDLIGGIGIITQYVNVLNDSELRYIEQPTLSSIQSHYKWLVGKI